MQMIGVFGIGGRGIAKLPVPPDLFELDDIGHCAIDTLELDERQLDAARRGAASCPEQAISLIEEM